MITTMPTKNIAVSLVALAASLAVASMAAPTCCIKQTGPDMNDIKSRILSGLRASDHYVVRYYSQILIKVINFIN